MNKIKVIFDKIKSTYIDFRDNLQEQGVEIWKCVASFSFTLFVIILVIMCIHSCNANTSAILEQNEILKEMVKQQYVKLLSYGIGN